MKVGFNQVIAGLATVAADSGAPGRAPESVA
jgi:hypothetical protein